MHMYVCMLGVALLYQENPHGDGVQDMLELLAQFIFEHIALSTVFPS